MAGFKAPPFLSRVNSHRGPIEANSTHETANCTSRAWAAGELTRPIWVVFNASDTRESRRCCRSVFTYTKTESKFSLRSQWTRTSLKIPMRTLSKRGIIVTAARMVHRSIRHGKWGCAATMFWRLHRRRFYLIAKASSSKYPTSSPSTNCTC